jgi:2-polyprenyl-3-methyl-5-hydroxy-6-metoxy-1,4-benzoquinol methylase
MRACFICQGTAPRAATWPENEHRPSTQPVPGQGPGTQTAGESADGIQRHLKVGPHDYLRCPRCGLVYVDEIEPAGKLFHSYDGGFWKSLRRKIVAPWRGFSQVRHFKRSMQRANAILEFVRSQNPNQGSRKAWLDIGCNKGFLLAAAAESSWEVHGVEIVPELTAPFRRKYKMFADNILAMGFAEAQVWLKDGSFDVVTAIDMIEHFEEPLRDMGHIHRVLAPGGLLVVQTPDTDAIRAGELKEKWGALKPLEHLHLFNRANLERLAKKLGFVEARFFEAFDREDGNLVAVFKKSADGR